MIISALVSVGVLFNLLSANITKWSNTLKQFVVKLPTNWLSVFDYFVGLALKGLTQLWRYKKRTVAQNELRSLNFVNTELPALLIKVNKMNDIFDILVELVYCSTI